MTGIRTIPLVLIAAILMAEAPAPKEKRDTKAPLTKVHEGQIRALYFKAARSDKDTVLKGEEFNTAIESLEEIAELPEKVKRAEWKAADRNKDGSVDWFEFKAFVRQEPLADKATSPAPQPAKPDNGGTTDKASAAVTKSHIVEQSGGRSFSVPGPVKEFASLYKDDPELFKAALAGDTNGDGILDRAESEVCWQTMNTIRDQRVLTAPPAAEKGGPGPAFKERPRRVHKTVAEKRADVLASHDANGDGALQPEEWRSYIKDLRTQRRKQFADADGKLDKINQIAWEANDNGILWSYSFDADRDGVLDEEETAQFMARMRKDPAFIRTPPPLLKELGLLSRKSP